MNSLQQAFADAEKLDPRTRGKAFEKVLGLMLEMEKIRHVLAYRPTGEEIDGAFWWNDHTFLLEAKWHKTPLPASSIYAFKGKVDGKFAGTCGVFISMLGFSDDCEDALVHGKALNILLFDGNDIRAIIGDNNNKGVKFTTMLTEKLFVAGQTGNIYLPWQDLQKVRRSSEAILSRPLFIFCEGHIDELIIRSLLNYIHTHDHLTLDNVRIISVEGKVSEIPSLVKLIPTSVSDSGAVLVVADADAIKTEEGRQLFIDAKQDIPNSWEYHVAIATPTIETWTGLIGGPVTRLMPFQTALGTINWDLQVTQIAELANALDFLKRVLPHQ